MKTNEDNALPYFLPYNNDCRSLVERVPEIIPPNVFWGEKGGVNNHIGDDYGPYWELGLCDDAYGCFTARRSYHVIDITKGLMQASLMQWIHRNRSHPAWHQLSDPFHRAIGLGDPYWINDYAHRFADALSIPR